MKILWSSNAPWTSSGYGNQTAMSIPLLQKLGHEVAVSCFFGLEGGSLDWNGVICYPTDVTRFGNLMLGEYAEHWGNGNRSDVLVMTLQDVWVLNQGLSQMKGLKFACWTPVDHDPAPPGVLNFLRESQARVIAMTRFGEKQLAEFDPFYIPHMVDTNVFKPIPEHKAEFRANLNLPESAFVVGMVGCNQGLPSRKSYPQVFQAFAEFQKKHSDAMMFVHADVWGRNQGVNLIELAHACGIPSEALRTSDQRAYHLGIPQDAIPFIYNAFDVLAMPSMGEGFGIPLIEAQACGVPVITTDFTAMTELVGPGWLVEGDKWWDQLQNSFQKTPHVGSILDAMEEAYSHAGSKGEASRQFSLSYDTDVVFETCWKPVMEQITKPREVAPLNVNGNRAQRRAKEKVPA